MAWSFRLSPRFPFGLVAFFLSLILSISIIVSSSIYDSYPPRPAGPAAIAAALHHVTMIMVFRRENTASRSQGKRACKFYVRVLWVPIIISIMALLNLIEYIWRGYGALDEIAQLIVVALELVLLLWLVFTSQYRENGSIALPPDAEVVPQSGDPSPRILRVVRFFNSNYSFHPSTPFSMATLVLSLVLACGVFGLSCGNEGSTSFGLNVVTSALYLGLGTFIALAFTETSPTNSDITQPAIYGNSPQMLHFARVSLRPMYFVGVACLAILSFVGATISGYHWIHYCENRYYDSRCYLHASSRLAVFLESVFGYALTATLVLGLIAPLAEDLEVSFRFGERDQSEQNVLPPSEPIVPPIAEPIESTAPTSPPVGAIPRSRQPFTPALLILSCLIGAPGFLIALNAAGIFTNYAIDALFGFVFLFFHHTIVIGIFTLISDFDPATYVPTLHGKTACRIYVWTLIVPVLFLISDAALAIEYIVNRRDNGWEHIEVELACDVMEVVVLILMMATATYHPYPPVDTAQTLPYSDHSGAPGATGSDTRNQDMV